MMNPSNVKPADIFDNDNISFNKEVKAAIDEQVPSCNNISEIAETILDMRHIFKEVPQSLKRSKIEHYSAQQGNFIDALKEKANSSYKFRKLRRELLKQGHFLDGFPNPEDIEERLYLPFFKDYFNYEENKAYANHKKHVFFKDFEIAMIATSTYMYYINILKNIGEIEEDSENFDGFIFDDYFNLIVGPLNYNEFFSDHSQFRLFVKALRFNKEISEEHIKTIIKQTPLRFTHSFIKEDFYVDETIDIIKDRLTKNEDDDPFLDEKIAKNMCFNNVITTLSHKQDLKRLEEDIKPFIDANGKYFHAKKPQINNNIKKLKKQLGA